MTNTQAFRDFQAEDIPVIKSPFGAVLDVNTLLKNIHFHKPVPHDEIIQFIAVAVKDVSVGDLLTEESLKQKVADRLNREYYPEYMGIKMKEKVHIPGFFKDMPLFTDSPFGMMVNSPLFEKGIGGLFDKEEGPMDKVKSFFSMIAPGLDVEAAMDEIAKFNIQDEQDAEDEEDANDALMSALIDNYGLTYMQAKEVSDMDEEDIQLILDIADRAHKRGREDQKRLGDD